MNPAFTEDVLQATVFKLSIFYITLVIAYLNISWGICDAFINAPFIQHAFQDDYNYIFLCVASFCTNKNL